MSDTVENRGAPASGGPGLVYLLFFLSGVAALIYEASWSRLVGLAIGNTPQAASIVLASMFTGLAIGQFIGGMLASRVPPLLGYGIAELIVAAWVCAILYLLDRVDTPAGCFLVLLPATVPLGATLPFVAEALQNSGVALAYGVNVAGGLIGIVAASAGLLLFVGVRNSGFLAASLSATCGLVACMSALRAPGRSSPSAEVSLSVAGGTARWNVIAALSGFGVLGLEVLFMRMFALVFHNSIYTFGAVVAVFLLALSVGAFVASRLSTRMAPSRIAALAFSLGGVALAAAVAAFPWATGLNYFAVGGTFAAYLLAAFGLVMLFVFPPIVLLGMAFPAVLQGSTNTKTLGQLTAINTFAAAIGALVAGFVLPSSLGLWPSFALFATLFVLPGVLLLFRERLKALAAGVGLTGAALASFIVSGPAAHDSQTELVRRWESAYGWIDVVRNRADDSLAVRQNLHYQHGSTAKAAREYRQGRVPLLLHPRPNEVAFLGLGTGLTAAPAVVDKDVENAVVVELIPEVVEASRLLATANLGVADAPKVEIHIDDARHFLRTTNRKFDVIVSDLFVPWENRTGYLYTVDFYEVVRKRLKPGGIFCQWIALYQVGPEQWESIADSFASAFPNTTIWWGQLHPRFPIVALVGSDNPPTLDADRLAARFEAQTFFGTTDPDLRSPADLAALFCGSWTPKQSRKLNTDEHPWLEFTAPIGERSGKLLRNQTLRDYYDAVLADLPLKSIPIDDEVQYRSSQRFSLFGDVILRRDPP